jgi:LacI family transcriptional regulator
VSVEVLSAGAGGIRYHDGADVDPQLSPRPHLTVATKGGVAATAVEPEDHLHHLGVSVAIPDVNGVTFWGGRTFVRDAGSQMLPNHGRQLVRSRRIDAGRIEERLDWVGPDDRPMLDERRTIVVRDGGDGIDVLWSTRLTAADGAVGFGSPHTNGRDGAFYGGIFWRTPFPTARVRCAGGEGTDAAHGSLSPWLALDGPDASLVATTGNDDMPWFVRADGYVGFGPAVAVTGRRSLAAGEQLHLDLRVAILDLPPLDPAAVARRLGA